MKKLIALVLALVCVVGIVGCSAKDEVIGKTVFETDNITRVTFYGSAPNSADTEVPSEYLAEITEWLGTFVEGKKADDVLPPGADSLFVRVEYSDGTVVENSMTTIVLDGKTYLINYDKEPQCYFELFADKDKLIYGEPQEPSNADIVNGEGEPLDIEGISQAKAEEIALEQCKVNYDYIKTEFNSTEKRWYVEFWENMAKDVATQTVLIDTEGNVLGSLYAE